MRSAGPPFPSEDLQMCTHPTGGPMDLPPWTLQHRYAGLSVGHLVPKKFHHNAAQLCPRQGLQFIPLVVEACSGGWGPIAVATSENWALCTLLD